MWSALQPIFQNRCSAGLFTDLEDLLWPLIESAPLWDILGRNPWMESPA